jgi:hypothetical protein
MRIIYGSPDGHTVLAVATVPAGTPCPSANDWVELPSPHPDEALTKYLVVRTFHRYRAVEEVVQGDIHHPAEEDIQVRLEDVVVQVEQM